jgi:peptidoglycan/xylan/chitin deacetylase (PgdA/CDA1 family)
LRTIVAAVAAAAALALPAAASAAPAPSITITTPVAGANYGLNTTVNANYSCAGATSCVGTFANASPIYTGQINSAPGGYYSFKVTAKDNRGRTVTKSANYNVVSNNSGACSAGYVALTYDDGPTTMTRQYVDTLKANGWKATFFDIGQNEQARPSDVQYTVNNGMRIEDHTWNHTDLTTLDDAGITSELKQQMDLTKQLTGETEVVYRPPYGAENGNTWNDAFALGLMETTWTYDTNDWTSPSVSSIVDGALANAHDQAIVLMHDGYPNTATAIPQIIAGLKTRHLCAGKIIQSWNNPINNAWGFPMYVNVVPF